MAMDLTKLDEDVGKGIKMLLRELSDFPVARYLAGSALYVWLMRL